MPRDRYTGCYVPFLCRTSHPGAVLRSCMELVSRSGKISLWSRLFVRRARPSYGRWGEWIALGYLLREGFDVVARRWTCRAGELDLVGFDGPELAFVEVKTRRKPTHIPPEYAVGPRKAAQLELLAQLFMRRYELYSFPARFDLIALETPDLIQYELRHYKGFL
ncbi:MAG TPA: YraN family protein [Acidobacteriota bacterium]|nr:YraN family protein [Acidobacteriota bacterium]